MIMAPSGFCRVPNNNNVPNFTVTITVKFSILKKEVNEETITRCGVSETTTIRTSSVVPAGNPTYTIKMVRDNTGNYVADAEDVANYTTNYDFAWNLLVRTCANPAYDSENIGPFEVECTPGVPANNACTPPVPAVPPVKGTVYTQKSSEIRYTPKVSVKVKASARARCRLY
jgi:hypothetical protein